MTRVRRPHPHRVPIAVVLALGAALILLATRCGPAGATTGFRVVVTHAEDGAKCYVVLNAGGEAVGGNCIE